MFDNKYKATLAFFLFFLIVGLYPLSAKAVVVVQSAIASGNVLQKHKDNAVTLDNGVTYHPSREDLEVTVPTGQPVTLRYMVDTEGENNFFEFAPGLNSLQPLPKRFGRQPDTAL